MGEMRFELEMLAECPDFELCRFYSPVEGKRISGLVLACSFTPDRWKPGDLLLICGPILPRDEEALESCVRETALRGAAGFLLDPFLSEEEWFLTLQNACLRQKLVLGTAPSDAWTAMIQAFNRLAASRTDGTLKPWDRVLEDLQHRFYTGGMEALLDGLTYWTGYQAALMAGQDTFVCSSMPVLDEAVFCPAYWHREPLKPAFSYVSLYTSSHSRQKLLKAQLYRNRLPFGELCLIAQKNRDSHEAGSCFDWTDFLLLNHAAILSGGMDDCRQRSRRIDRAIDRFCKGDGPNPDESELFPPSGYALVLLEQEVMAKTSSQKEPTDGKQDYLSYLLRHSFPRDFCFSFARDGCLRLFAAADDIDHLGRKILRVLDRAGRRFRAGISRRYPIAQAAAAFFEARNAAHIAQLLEYEERLCRYEDLGIYRLFDYPESSWPVNQMLGEMDVLLNQMDQEKRDTLAMTVRVFVNNRFSYQKTADKLYTHVNTVCYRIKLIEDLWGVNLSSDEGRLLFSVLAKLLPLWMKSGHYSGTMPGEEEGREN